MIETYTDRFLDALELGLSPDPEEFAALMPEPSDMNMSLWATA